MSADTAAWPFFEHVCVINLDSRPDRWAKMSAMFAAMGVHGVQRFAAVSADDQAGNPPPPHFVDSPWAKSNGHLPGDRKLLSTWACLRSHVEVLKLARREGWPHVLILEDDCDFESYAKPVLQRVERQAADQDWDMLYLGGTSKKGGRKTKVSKNLYSVDKVRRTHAYLVRASLYDRIIEQAPQACLPVDWYYSDILLPQVNALFIEPQVAFQRVNETSDIAAFERKPQFNLQRSLKRLYARLRYRCPAIS